MTSYSDASCVGRGGRGGTTGTGCENNAGVKNQLTTQR